MSRLCRRPLLTAGWLIALVALAACGARVGPPAPVQFLGDAATQAAPAAAAVPVLGGLQPVVPHPDRITIARGETLYGAARRYGVPVRSLIDANHLTPPYRLAAGSALLLPQNRTHVVRAGETLEGIARLYGVEVSSLVALNHLTPPYAIRSGEPLALPATVVAGAAPPPHAAASPPAVTGPPLSAAPPSLYAAAVPPPAVAPGSAQLPAGVAPPFPVVAAAPAIATPPALAAVPPRSAAPAWGPAPAQAVATPQAQSAAAWASAPSSQLQPPPTFASPATAPRSTAVASLPLPPPPGSPPPSVANPPPRTLGPPPSSSVAALPPRVLVPETAPRQLPPEPPPVVGPLENTVFLWPVQGRILSGYGIGQNGAQNDGINIAAPAGTPVLAAAAGVVAYAGNELRGYGDLVLIKHDKGFMTAYAHNERLLVKRGDVVRRGQPIATVGATGAVSQPQLHFEIRRGTRALDPRTYLPALTAAAGE